MTRLHPAPHTPAFFALCCLALPLFVGCFNRKTPGDTGLDGDGDGSPTALDCDDEDPEIYPGATEICDGQDNDCDGLVDAADDATGTVPVYTDGDGDGFGVGSSLGLGCPDTEGLAENDWDCDDTQAQVNPEQVEDCFDGVDNDCDGVVDGCGVGMDEAGIVFYGEAAGDEAGQHTAFAGDVDADGHTDVLVGSENAHGAGSAYLVLNPQGGPSSLSEADTIFVGESAGDKAGRCAIPAGDVNGDDRIDLFITAPGEDTSGPNSGAAYLLLGREGGWPPGVVGLADADAKIIAGAEGAWLADATAVGDVDGDGLDDVLVGAQYAAHGDVISGGAFLLRGPITAMHSLADASCVFTGEADGDDAGSALAGPGDLDGDGLADFAVGARYADRGGRDAGAVYVFFGPASGTISLGEADRIYVGPEGDALLGGGWSLSGAGDVDGDGYPDLLAGASTERELSNGTGAAWLLAGGDLATDLGAAQALFLGPERASQMGYATDGAGDVNADGFADVVVGAPGGSGEEVFTGVAFLWLGPLTGTLAAGEASQIYLGVASGDMAARIVAGGGDVDGDHLADLMFGALGNDTTASEAGAVYLFPSGG